MGTNMNYLKYYFLKKDDKIFLDNIACKQGEEPEKPDGFVKWYEDGDVEFKFDVKPYLNCDSPVFSSIFNSKLKVNFQF